MNIEIKIDLHNSGIQRSSYLIQGAGDHSAQAAAAVGASQAAVQAFASSVQGVAQVTAAAAHRPTAPAVAAAQRCAIVAQSGNIEIYKCLAIYSNCIAIYSIV